MTKIIQNIKYAMNSNKIKPYDLSSRPPLKKCKECGKEIWDYTPYYTPGFRDVCIKIKEKK